MTSAIKHKQRSHRSYRMNRDRRDRFTRQSMLNSDRVMIARANRIQTTSFADAMKNMMENVKNGMKKIVGGKEENG